MPIPLIEKMKFQSDDLPNKLSVQLGELIRKGRTEAKLSQSELAEYAYFSQAAISQIEQGKRSVSVEEIVYLSVALNKPILYFFSFDFIPHIDQSNLTIQEQELIELTKNLSRDDMKRIIAQVRALTNLE